jgi:N12 class adenine-specific DNA methylase
MAQPPQTSGYDLITEGPPQDEQQRLKQYRLFVEQQKAEEEARKRRQKALDDYLMQYDDDPLSQAIAQFEFEEREAEAQKKAVEAQRKAERDKIVSQYDDPLTQAWKLAEHDIEKGSNLDVKQAQADTEQYEELQERDATARKLDRIGKLGGGIIDAFVRESAGAAIGVVPNLAAVPARAAESVGLVEEGTTAELHRASGRYRQAQEQARENDFSPWLSRMYGGAAESFLQMAGTPGGAYTKIGGAGVMSGNEALTTAEDAGLEGMAKYRYAGTQGLIEAGVAAIGQKFLGPGLESRLAGQRVAAATWKQLSKEVGADALKEMPEEVVTAILQNVSTQMEGISPGLTFEDYVTDATEAAVQAAMMAGMGGAMSAPGVAARKRQARRGGPGTFGEQRPIPQELDAFIRNPSRRKYDKAVKAGVLPPIGEAAKDEAKRKAYADGLAEAYSQELVAGARPADQPEGRILTDEEMGIEPEAPPVEATPELGPEDMAFVDEIQDLIRKGEEDERQGDEVGQEQLQEREQAQVDEAGVQREEQQGQQPGPVAESSAPAESAVSEAPPDQSSTPVATGPVSRLRGADEAVKPVERFQREITPRRLKIAEKSIERLKARNPLFADEIAQEEGTPEERLKRIDTENADRWVKRDEEDKRRFLEATEQFKLLPENMLADAEAEWNTGRRTASGYELANFINGALRGSTRLLKGIAHPEVADETVREKAEQLERRRALIEDLVATDRGAAVESDAKMRKELEELGVTPNEVGRHEKLNLLESPQPAEAEQPAAEPVEAPPEGSIGLNSGGEPIYESKTGIRTVGGEMEQATGVKKVGDQMKAVLAAPREDKFRTDEELRRKPSALKRYPEKIPHPDVPGKEVDAPPIFLTGVSNDQSRDAAKRMSNLGVLVTPRTQQYRKHLDDYQFFGVDNGAFSGKFNEESFYKLLDNIREQGDAEKALFVAAPDVVGDWKATLERSEPHLDRIRDAGFPVAIVLQNGATPDTVPWDRIDALFVGGDDSFKLSQKDKSGTFDPYGEIIPLMREAKKRGVPVHFGRVNSAKRLEIVHFGLGGRSVDGTFLKFGDPDEMTKKVVDWLKPWGTFPAELKELYDAERESYEELAGIDDERITEGGVDQIRQLSEEEGTEAADVGAEEGDLDPDRSEEIIDASVDLSEPKAETVADISFKELNARANRARAMRTIRVQAGERALVLEYTMYEAWKVFESKPYRGKKSTETSAKPHIGEQLVTRVPTLRKAKDAARRIISDPKFKATDDLIFHRKSTADVGLTNARIGKEIKSLGMRSHKLASTLREDGLVTDTRFLMRVKSDSQRDAILKGVGKYDENTPKMAAAARLLADGQNQFDTNDTDPLEVLAYRGGDIQGREIALWIPDGKVFIVDKVLYDTVRKTYPDANLHHISGQIGFEQNGDIVALVMPLDLKNDPHVAVLEKENRNYPFLDDPIERPTPKKKPAPAGDVVYRAERKTGTTKEGPTLGVWYSRDRAAVEHFADGGEVTESNLEAKNLLTLTAEEFEGDDAITVDEMNQQLSKAGVEFAYDKDEYDEGEEKEAWRWIDIGGPPLVKAVRKAGFDGIEMPERVGNKVSQSLLVFPKSRISKSKPAAKKPAAKLPDQLADTVRKLVQESGSPMVLISKIRALPQYEGVSKSDFDAAMMDQHKQQVLELSRHDAPLSIKEPARSQQLVKDGDTYYNAVALRKEKPAPATEPDFDPDQTAEMAAILGEEFGTAPAAAETATAEPVSDEQWWDTELTSTGRQNFLRAAGLMNSTRVKWKYLSEKAKEKLRAQRSGAIDVIESPGAKKPKKAVDTRKAIADAAMKIGGEPNVRVRLSQLRAEIGDSVPRQKLDDTLQEMERNGELALYPLENPLEIKQADREAVLRTGVGLERHVLYFVGLKPKKRTQASPAVVEGKAFLDLPYQSRARFNQAFEEKNVADMQQMVEPRNKTWRNEFIKRTGIKLPRTIKGTHNAVMEWAGVAPPVTGIKAALEKARGRTEATAKELDDAVLDMAKEFGSTAPMAKLTPGQMRASARLVKAAVNHGVSKFNEFVIFVADKLGNDVAMQAASGLELAWHALRRLPDYSDIDPAGSVAEIIAERRARDERSEQNDREGDGGVAATDRPVGAEPVETPEADSLQADEAGGDAGGRGDRDGGSPDGETPGVAEVEDGRTRGVSASEAGRDSDTGRGGRVNFRITEDDGIGDRFYPSERFRKNVEAIRLLKKIEAENRRATPEEQQVLVQYVGWGGLKEAFSTREDQGQREKAILAELLTDEEWRAARKSLRNAHYTSPDVIESMWKGLVNAGFSGGRILEPSMGIGHFFGLVPQEIADASQMSGIEMDSLSARIAKQLYQGVDVQHAPFQNVNLQQPQDLIISNVPFGKYTVRDKYDKSLKKGESVHNFFFLKALKNVRPGGVVAFITSRYTMDAVDTSIRDKIAEAGGRFVGAVRLPNNTFMGIAKTKVTTDVIFIQKEAGDAQPWRNGKEDADGFFFNEYYHEHPENVLGKIDPKGGTQIDEWGLAPSGHNVPVELAMRIAEMPFDRATMAENSTEGTDLAEAVLADADVEDGHLTVKDSKLFLAVGGKLEEVPIWGGARGLPNKFAIIRKMQGLAGVREALSALELDPLATDEQIEAAREKLNTEYDRFVKKHGFIHKKMNQGLFLSDEYLPTLLALEEWDSDNDVAKKADVFTSRVQSPTSDTKTPTTAEGAAVESYARMGRIDLPTIAEWLEKSEAQVEDELRGWAYKDPASGEWFLKNVYLSGNIAKKLKAAEAAAKDDPAYQKNVEDLKRVLPPRKRAGQIHVRPRSPFITGEQYKAFMQHMGVDGTVRHDDISGAWLIDSARIVDGTEAAKWSVGQKSPVDLLNGLLNNKAPTITRPDGKGGREVDEAATQLARAKARQIEEEFGKWVFSDPDRATKIEDAFNETVGAFIEGDWDGSHLTLPGMNVNVQLMPHQKNAIWRAIVTGNTMLAHEVGLGKTYIMAAIAMERKRLGLADKQMFVVPNHLLAQWASEFKALYPSAKLLALESDQINAKTRRTLTERVKSGRFDAIIVTPEAYKKIPMSNDVVMAKMNAITDEIEAKILEARKAKGDNKNFVAKLEAVLESIQSKMAQMLNADAKDAGAKFDELGIDALYVDEAHEYRNLWSMTQMGDISGVGLDGNQKTFDMVFKTDYLNETTNHRGIVFATGTPIANSISELYSMQRYLQPQTLAEANVGSFDDWANTFGDAVTDIEVNPTGSGFRSKTRFKEFRNTVALSKIFRQVADVKYAEDVGLDKARPRLVGGSLKAIQVMPSVGLLAYVKHLVRRAEISKSRNFDKTIDNLLKVTTDGRKAALDLRLVQSENDAISSKVNHAVENVARVYHEEGERKGAQLMWVNLGTPASKKKKKKKKPKSNAGFADPRDLDADVEDETGGINVYEDIKRKLVAQGIPADEIQFIHDHDKKKKQALFRKVRSGEVRIVISTVKKLATGANIQTRMAAMHFLDPPWKPADIEQALGRAIRRGNLYKDWGGVQAYTYVTRGSFDAYVWQLLENKAKAIKQIMRGETDSVEDTGRIELNPDEVKALASSNPKVLDLVRLRNSVGQLRAESAGYDAEQNSLRSEVGYLNSLLRNKRKSLKEVEAELASLPSRDDLPEKFEVKIGKGTYSKRSEVGNALIEAMPAIDAKDEKAAKAQIKELQQNPVRIGSVFGRSLFAGRGLYENEAIVVIGHKMGPWFRLGEDAAGNGVKLFNYFDKLFDAPEQKRKEIAGVEAEIAAKESRIGIPWDKADRLKAESEQLDQLIVEVGEDAGKEGQVPVVSNLTKLAIMADMLGQKLGRPVTFDGKTWNYGDRTPVPDGAVTPEMIQEVDDEVKRMLEYNQEKPIADFFFEYKPPKEVDPARAQLNEMRRLAAQHDAVILKEWKRVTQGGMPASGIPITDEMARAVAKRIALSIKIGVKSFEILVGDLRKTISEDVIQALKPSLMRTWNTLAAKHGLDPATDVQFEAAMATTADTDEEEAMAAAKGETVAPQPTPKPVPDGPRQYSTKNAFSAAAREYLGMGERAPVDTVPREVSVQMAAAVGPTEAGRAQINGLIQSLMIEPRTVTPFENALLDFRNAELGEKHRAAMLRQIEAASRGDDAEEAAAATDAAVYASQRRVLIEKVLEPVGTAWSRAGHARQAVINEDYSLERSAMMFEAAYKRKPTSEELAKMQDQVNTLKKAEAKLKAALAARNDQVEDLEKKLDEAHKAAVKAAAEAEAAAVRAAEVAAAAAAQASQADQAAPPRKSKAKAIRDAVEKSAKKKIDAAFKDINSLFTTQDTAPSLAAFADPFLRLAEGYAELGVVRLADFLSRVKKRLGPRFEQVREQAVSAWKHVRQQQEVTDDDLFQITGNLDPSDPDSIGRVARDLHSYVIARDGLDASPEGREAAVKAVHEILSRFITGMTRGDVARAMSGIGLFTPLSQDEIEVIRRDQKAQLLLLEQIEDWKKGEIPPATGREAPPVSDEQRTLRRFVNAAKKAAGLVESKKGQLKSALDAAKRGTRNRIADLNKALDEREPIQRSRKVLETDTELDALRLERDELQQRYDEMFGRPELSEEQRISRAERALDRAIAGLESDLKVGKLYPDPLRDPPTSPAIEAKRLQLEALKANRDELRLQSGEAQARSDAAYERLLRERDAKLAKRIADKDFAPPKKKEERKPTKEMLRLMLSIEKQKQTIRRERAMWEFKNSHPIYKGMIYGPVMGTGVTRKLLTTIDQSYIARQGYLLGASHPVLYAKSIKKAFANPLKYGTIFPTEQHVFDAAAELDADSDWVRLEKKGRLAVTETHGGLNREEEHQFSPEWMNKVWGIGGSERAVSAFINTQRRLVFRSLVDKLATMRGDDVARLSDADLKVIGNLVNVASGRAGLGKWEGALQGAAAVFFSPRWWMSRLAWWSGQPMWHESRWFGGTGASAEVRKLAMMEWGKQAAAQALIMGLAIAGLTAAFGDPGEDEEWDFYASPISPNFGKIRIQNTYIDMTAGLGQHMSYLSRLATGRQKDRWEENEIDRWRLAIKYGRGKLAPLPSAIADFFVGKNMGQEKFGGYEWIKSSVTPLVFQDFFDTAKADGYPMASVIGTMMFFGLGVQSYDERVRDRKDVANEVRAAVSQGQSPEAVRELLDKHFAYQAAVEAKDKLRGTDDPAEMAEYQRIIDAVEAERPDLVADAIEKEKGDLTLMAAQMLSSEDRKRKKSTDADKAIQSARDLLRQMAPTFSEANAIYNKAYIRRNKSLTEVVGGRFRIKKSVLEARRRLRAMYAN